MRPAEVSSLSLSRARLGEHGCPDGLAPLGRGLGRAAREPQQRLALAQRGDLLAQPGGMEGGGGHTYIFFPRFTGCPA